MTLGPYTRHPDESRRRNPVGRGTSEHIRVQPPVSSQGSSRVHGYVSHFVTRDNPFRTRASQTCRVTSSK